MEAINLTDGYKVDHRRQMPEEASYQLNNSTPRKSRRVGVVKTVNFGMTAFMKRYLIKKYNEWFALPEDEAVRRYKRRIDNYLGPGHGVTFDHIRDLHRLQLLPIRIKALKEGSRSPYKVPTWTVESTRGHKYVWLVGYLETLMSTGTWGMSTSATTAFEMNLLFSRWAMKTVGNRDFVPFQGHDFSMRGMFGIEAAVMSGMAHLTSFVGTDTIPAIDGLEAYYNADSDKELIGCSVAATEHSVMCFGTGLYVYSQLNGDWERIGEAEFGVFKRLITEVYPRGIISIVSDTFNLWRVLTEYLPALKSEILARDGKVVIRPDSGDPVDILCGKKGSYSHKTDLYHRSDPANPTDKGWTMDEYKGVVELLWDTFGGTTTEQGYKVLDSHVGTIYGDSINMERAEAICQRLADKGFASINWVAGMGSYLYQYVTRDTDGTAIKATYGEATFEDGTVLEIPIFKDPITDDGTKKSARGRICVLRGEDGELYLKDQCTKEEQETGELKEVFFESQITKDYTLAEVRANIIKELDKEL